MRRLNQKALSAAEEAVHSLRFGSQWVSSRRLAEVAVTAYKEAVPHRTRAKEVDAAQKAKERLE